MSYKYSATQWIFGKEPLATTIGRLRSCGYDGIELSGEPDEINVTEAAALLAEAGMCCTSICGIYNGKRNLSSSYPDVRANAVRYVKRCVDMAAAVGAAHVIVVPSPVGKLTPDSTQEEAWRHAVTAIREAGQYAAAHGVSLCIEALNRYETHLVNRLADAARLMREADCPAVKLMADLFHMNMEERSVVRTLEAISADLIHVHIADNTREAAGWGQTDMEGVMRTLHRIGYAGPLTMEFLPPVANPYEAADAAALAEPMLQAARQSIEHIKSIAGRIGPSNVTAS